MANRWFAWGCSLALLCLWVFLPKSLSAADGEPAMQQLSSTDLLLQNCFACHGPDGYSQRSAIPSLAGLPEDYFIQVMQAFQHGGRFSTLMGRLAPAISQQQIAGMARYFAELEVKPAAKQRLNWERAKQGRRLHREFCRECHGDRKRQPKRGIPRLHGQWLDYLRWTLKDILIGVSQADPEMMRQLERLLRQHGDSGLESLLLYYAVNR